MASGKEDAGADKTELKKFFRVAQTQPVHMAFALGADGKAILKLDKMRPPRALEKVLKDEPGSKSHRFGTVIVDASDSKLARFIVNKEIGGFARKLAVALKGTGISKVVITSEDGTALEEAAEEEEVASASAPDSSSRATPQHATAPNPSSADSASNRNERGAGSVQQLSSELIALVRQTTAAIGKDPELRQKLLSLASAAQAGLKRGDVAAASAGIESLRKALAASPMNAGGPEAALDPATLRKLDKLCEVWDAAAAKVERDVERLIATVAKLSADHELGVGFERDFRSAMVPLFQTVDKRLPKMLRRAADTKDAAEHQEILVQARDTVGELIAFVRSSPVIAHLDENPFEPIAVGKTLIATLSAISSTIR